MARRVVFCLVSVVLMAFVVSTASAKLPFTVFGEVGFGKLMEDGAPGGSVGFGAGLIYKVPSTPVLGIGADLGYVMLGKDSESAEFGGGVGGSIEAKWSVIPVTAQVYYLFPSKSSMGGYLDGGAGFYNTRVKVSGTADLGGFGSYSVDDTSSDTNFGVNFGGGLKFGQADKKMAFGVDGKFHVIMTEGNSTNMLTVFGRLFFD